MILGIFSKWSNISIKKSYIHRDISYQIAGLIYLNDTNDINSGTTLYDENFNEQDSILIFSMIIYS